METASQKLDAIDNALLTHQPADQMGASRMSDNIENRRNPLIDELKLGLGMITQEQITNKQVRDDGVMRVIED